jgi:beta-hydroxylase
MLDSAREIEPREAPPAAKMRNWRRRLIMHFGGASRHWISAIIARYSKIGDPAVFPAGDFSWLQDLRRAWPAVRAEADRVLADRANVPPLIAISPDHVKTADTKWKSFFLWGYGYRINDNCARCPETAALLDKVPGLISGFYSIMEPGARLKPHRGVTKAFLTCHLGLRVPREADRCWIRVEGKRYVWRDGEWFVFDDTYEHEVRNETDEERVILLLHVKRPVRFPGSLISNGFLSIVRASPFIQDALKNLEDWNSRPH